jgi:ABC-type multidrug transport system permease subunit
MPALAFDASNAHHKQNNITFLHNNSMSGTLYEYLWIAIAGGIFGFVYTFSIGANDVANAFVRIAT